MMKESNSNELEGQVYFDFKENIQKIISHWVENKTSKAFKLINNCYSCLYFMDNMTKQYLKNTCTLPQEGYVNINSICNFYTDNGNGYIFDYKKFNVGNKNEFVDFYYRLYKKIGNNSLILVKFCNSLVPDVFDNGNYFLTGYLNNGDMFVFDPKEDKTLFFR